MKRKIKASKNSEICIVNTVGEGGSNHEYSIDVVTEHGTTLYDVARMKFQRGPVGEFGVNGCTQEDLLAIVIDRLRCFQVGPFPCRENALALTKCQEALHWLEHRTRDRVTRGVEGKTEA